MSRERNHGATAWDNDAGRSVDRRDRHLLVLFPYSLWRKGRATNVQNEICGDAGEPGW